MTMAQTRIGRGKDKGKWADLGQYLKVDMTGVAKGFDGEAGENKKKGRTKGDYPQVFTLSNQESSIYGDERK